VKRCTCWERGWNGFAYAKALSWQILALHFDGFAELMLLICGEEMLTRA